MAKPLLKTQTPFSTLLMIFSFFLVLLNNVKSESFSFSFSDFGSPGQENTLGLGLFGDARPSGGVIQLTRRDGPYGNILRQHSVGRAVYIPPVNLWNKTTGTIADFTTEFSFVTYSDGLKRRGDGLSFFIIPSYADTRIPKNSSGGYLGLFIPENAFNSYKNQIVAVEFDSFGNEWDPKPVAVAPHVGIDVNSLLSVATAEWPINSVPDESVGKARISYDSTVKELSVVLGYTDTQPNRFVTVTSTIDLRTILPEWVTIGFSGATGNEVEAHDILSWSFSSRL